MWRNIIVLLLFSALISPAIAQGNPTQIAQVRISPTPVSVIIPTSTQPATEMAVATATPTYTATPEGPAIARAIPNELDQAVNVRALPDPNADVVGTLEFETDYVVTGKYFSWWQIDFSRAPGGRGYVFESVVDVSIGSQPVPDVDPYSEPTPDPEAENAEGEAAVGPDGRVLDIPTPDPSRQLELDESVVLPTFTPPPDLVVVPPTTLGEQGITPTPDLFTAALNTVSSGGIPPIVPIGVLGGLGALGMLIAVIRR